MRSASPSRSSLRQLDLVDKATLPLFAATMAGEALALRRVERFRRVDDLDDAALSELSGSHLPPDPLVPVGYERRDTVASLTMLAGNIVAGFAAGAVLGRLNEMVFRRRISDIGTRRGAIVGAMVLWDFLYYWDHRWMHEVRLLWANHVTHHSSRRYNLSTALRQPWSGIITAWVFLPMPLLGFRTATIMKAAQLNLLYQYSEPDLAVLDLGAGHHLVVHLVGAVGQPQVCAGCGCATCRRAGTTARCRRHRASGSPRR
jgi:hypothetical protein